MKLFSRGRVCLLIFWQMLKIKPCPEVREGIGMSKTGFFFVGIFFSAILLILFVPAPSAEIKPVSSALHVLPPVGDDPGNKKALDRTLTDFLKVQMCERTSGEGCTIVGESTSSSGFRSSRLRLLGKLYRTIWRPPFGHSNPKGQKEKEFEIHFIVAGLEVGFINYQSHRANVLLPIQFRIDNHPVIRARVLYAQGFTATQVAGVLIEEFSRSRGCSDYQRHRLQRRRNNTCAHGGVSYIPCHRRRHGI